MSDVTEYLVAIRRDLLNQSFDSTTSESSGSQESDDASASSPSPAPFDSDRAHSSDEGDGDDDVDDDGFESSDEDGADTFSVNSDVSGGTEVEVEEFDLPSDSDSSGPDVESIGFSFAEPEDLAEMCWRRQRRRTTSNCSLLRFVELSTSPRRDHFLVLESGDEDDFSVRSFDFGDYGEGESDNDGDSPSETWWIVESEEPEMSERRSICVECGRDVVGPRFSHCRKCWIKWRSYYATLPKSRKKKALEPIGRKRKRSSSSDSDDLDGESLLGPSFNSKRRRSTQESSCYQSSACSLPSSVSAASTVKDEGDSEDNSKMCLCCGVEPAEMSLEHATVMHQCVCLKCSRKLIKTRGPKRKCPLCNRRFTGVVKVFN